MTPYFDEAAIDYQMVELGEAITIVGVAGRGIFDETDEELLRGDMAALIGKAIALTVKTSAFATVMPGDAVVRTGPPTVNFKVQERLQLGDGALTKLLLGRA
jgi:hypothetical protein